VPSPGKIVADQAYDSDPLRDDVAERNSKLLSPHKSNRKKPPRDQEQIGRYYTQRWLVERLFEWLAPFAAWQRAGNQTHSTTQPGSTSAVSLIYDRGGLWPLPLDDSCGFHCRTGRGVGHWYGSRR